jgi:hypothetical protein
MAIARSADEAFEQIVRRALTQAWSQRPTNSGPPGSVPPD